jgi:hypothetical protein
MQHLNGAHDSLSTRVLEVLDKSIATGEEQGLVASVPPPHEIRRPAIGAAHLKHLAVSVRLADPVPVDHDSVSNVCSHGYHLSRSRLIVREALDEG